MRRLLLLLVFVSTLPAVSAAPTAAELAELFLPPQFYLPKLSPHGEYLGFMARQGDLHAIGVYNFATRKMEFKGGSAEIVPIHFWWKTPTRLLVETTSEKRDAIGYTAFDADGKNLEDVWRISGKFGVLFDALPAEPENVLMLRHGDIVKVNIERDLEETVQQQLNRVRSWIVDERGQPRAALQSDFQHGEVDVWWNKMAGGAWQSHTFTSKGNRFYPAAVATDPRYLVGWEFSNDEDVMISRLDTTTGQVEALNRITGRDPTSILLLGLSRKPIALAYEQGATMKLVALAEADAPGIARLEKQYAGYLTRIVDTMPDGKNWLVWVGNSRLPGVYVLFNHETSESYALAFSHEPALKESRFAYGEYFTFKSRDGVPLSARLWRPRDNPSPPLIVICPEELPAQIVPDVFNPVVQSFVLQGFAVLGVNVRNSWGFGKAGRQVPQDQWIRTLQEDQEDAVQTLAAQKVVDPAHVNLYGEYFGGVLALQVAARSKAFTAVATLNVPREIHRDDLFKLAAEPGTNPLAAKFGGWAESEKFAKELSPLKVVPTLSVRALYLHNEEGSFKGRLSQDGREIADAAKKAPAPAESGLAFTWSQYPKLPTKHAMEWAEVSRKVAAFFGPPAPAAAK
jgi:dipeptidyl aminopeptidase/acylaminoacyl peptidase